MSIIVYGTPDCVMCDATERAMKKHQLDYDKVDLTQDQDALTLVKSLGYEQAPVVVVGDDHWSGFRLDKIREIVK